MKWTSLLLDLLFPPKCAFCGRLLHSGERTVCSRCAKALPYVEDNAVVRKGAYGRCAVSLYYEDMVREGIHGYKFGGRQNCAGVFAQYMVQTAAEHLSGEFDQITFVPVSRRRLKERGYDQSRLLAEAMAKCWEMKAVPTLRKVRHTPPQSGLGTPEERRANVLGVYEILPGAEVAGGRFLLVDDVLTTGSTMDACVQTLRQGGAASVVCAALATPRTRSAKKADSGDASH